MNRKSLGIFFIVGILLIGISIGILLISRNIGVHASFPTQQAKGNLKLTEIYVPASSAQTNGPDHDSGNDLLTGSHMMIFQVKSPSQIRYHLTIDADYDYIERYQTHYWTDTVDVSINNQSARTVSIRGCPGLAQGQISSLCSTSLTIELKQGQNTIKLFNETGWMSWYCGPDNRSGCTHVHGITLRP
jgi:hypothetical protein